MNATSTSATPPPLDEVIDPGWAKALNPVEGTIREMGTMLRRERAEGRSYLPAATNILRAFTYPFDQVKVLIVGQDPYPTPGHAMGLSFSVTPETPLPGSLRNIYKELHDDLDCPPPANGDLTPWAEQGVCLLNRVLTVTPGAPASHRGRGWEIVTEQAIKALAARRQPLVAILWGKQAEELRPMLGDTPVIVSTHPSPLSAHRGFLGSRPFSRANVLLEQQGATPVNWCLPAVG